MSDDIDNFMRLIDEAESAPVTAPFGLGLDTTNGPTNKFTLLKCRAKNFRSIGNEFMEIDFTRSRSTLVVSEDNGSGKSTMCVWAPFYAMFDKPFAPKEKKGGMINSSTKKHMMVELEFNTKGKTYLIKRGAAPNIFEIYFQDESMNWILIESEAARRDQQKFLESIIGFDAKIAENVMILGTDKFVPFVEMDAPSRRHVVETIWDLGVFSEMLKIAKVDHAVTDNKLVEVGSSLEKFESKILHNKQMAEEVSSQKSSVDQLGEMIAQKLESIRLAKLDISEAEALSGKESSQTKIKLSEMEAELKEITASVEIRFQESFELATKMLSDSEVDKSLKMDEVSKEFDHDIEKKTQLISSAIAARESSLLKAKSISSKKYQELSALVGEAEANAAAEVETLKASRVFKAEEAETVEIAYFASTLTKLQADLELVSKELSDAETYDVRLMNENTEHQRSLTHQRQLLAAGQLELGKLTKTLDDYSHIGTCPTCSQVVAEGAIEAMKKSLEPVMADAKACIESIEEEITSIERAMVTSEAVSAQSKNVIKGATDSVKICSDAIANTEGTIKKLESALLLKERKFSEDTSALCATLIANATSAAKSNASQFLSDCRADLSKLESSLNMAVKEAEASLESSNSLMRAKQAEVRIECEQSINDCKRKLENIKSDFNSDLKDATSDIWLSIRSLEEKLKDLSSNLRFKRNSLNLGILQHEEERVTMKGRMESLNLSIEQKSSNLSGELEGLLDESSALTIEFNSLSERLQTLKYLINELGDKAAKAAIIKAYIPFFNKKVNEYLEGMNLFVGFRIDESFEVNFDSPDRKGQTTFSLSKGQLTRMNLAVLFALRDVANLKASVDSNILILDEIIEPLSEQGVREIVEMMKVKFTKMNVFVISQRATEFSEYFNSTIKYGLRGGFTSIV